MNHLGNTTCTHNAHSLHLRCAIKPCGPCETCPDYARASLGDRLKKRLWILDKRNIPATKNITFQILKGSLGGILVGAPLELFLASTVVMPALNQIIAETHPCWPMLGVNRYCSLGSKPNPQRY
jgi:Family of unknown function (DUF6464)